MLDEAGRLHVVRMRHDELFVLRRCPRSPRQVRAARSAVDQRHRHGLAFTLPESKPVTTGEARRLCRRSLELIDHLAFGQREFAEWDRETGVFRKELHFDFAEADFTGERMGSTKSALGRISEREKKSLVAPGKILQPQVAVRRKAQRLTREIADCRTGSSACWMARSAHRRPRISVTRGPGHMRCTSPVAGAGPASMSSTVPDRADDACSRRSDREFVHPVYP